MKKYEPLIQEEKGEWLKLDDEKRIELVKAYHEELEEEFEGESLSLHCAMHVIVENQVAQGEEYVENAVARITRQGLSKHEAVHAIAAIISEEIYNLPRGNTSKFSIKKYRRKLEKITAKRVRKGQY
jgi:hypothetical protein